MNIFLLQTDVKLLLAASRHPGGTHRRVMRNSTSTPRTTDTTCNPPIESLVSDKIFPGRCLLVEVDKWMGGCLPSSACPAFTRRAVSVNRPRRPKRFRAKSRTWPEIRPDSSDLDDTFISEKWGSSPVGASQEHFATVNPHAMGPLREPPGTSRWCKPRCLRVLPQQYPSMPGEDAVVKS